MEKKIYKAFIASPSDTSKEREACDKVFEELNSNIGEIYNFRIESLKWEKDVRPTIQNKDCQSIIFDQVGNNYELFIGIMSKKFGSPTPRAGSGTEEEFNEVFARYKEKGDVEMIFYFNDEPPVSMSDFKPEEFLKISNFKKQLEPIGIYGLYNGIFDFEEKLRRHLSKYFIEQFKKINGDPKKSEQIINKEAIRKIYKRRLNDSLKGYDEQPIVWIEPVLTSSNKISQNPDENYNLRIPLEEVLLSNKNYLINAPSQFGLTSLGCFLVSEAWENNDLWIFLDNNKTKLHTIHSAVKNEAESLDLKIEDVKCVVFDSYNSEDKTSFKKLKKLIESIPGIKIIVLNSVEEKLYLNNGEIEDEIEEKDKNNQIDIDFVYLHLLALPRNQIRQIVKQYNEIRKIEDDEKVLNKVTTELECLNLHRTPFNIITILKVAERYFDDSPVNRTRMIEMILFVLFDMGEVPKYKTKPDLKDCEYVLGRYCEIMIRKEKYEFSKEEFILDLRSFCKEKLIDLDIEVVFEVLFLNNIIVYDYSEYRFKSSFWIYYFAAKRMHNSEEFRDFIFDSKKYATFPEIVEFYTGIDRNRDDALNVLLKDIISTREIVETKLGIKGDINPLSSAKWNPSQGFIENVKTEIGENVLASNLPDIVKDQYLDKTYDQVKPYNQSIQRIFEEYSLVSLMRQIKAASTALRNSDYSDPQIKKELLAEIYKSWNQLAKVLFALSPIMASNGKAVFEGASFELHGNFGSNFEERLNRVIQVLPTNVVGYFKDDLFSPKIGPLLFEHFVNDNNDLMKHHQALLLIIKRPNGWKKFIEDYITTLNKNSYYLFGTVMALRTRYRYDFATKEELNEIKYLVKLGLAKHEFGGQKPGLSQIIKIPDSELPKREFGD
jgi:hypothetical protein